MHSVSKTRMCVTRLLWSQHQTQWKMVCGVHCAHSSEAFLFWKCDMEAHVHSHLLTRYYLCNQCCDFCLAALDPRSPELSWGDLTLRALWRHAMTMVDLGSTRARDYKI